MIFLGSAGAVLCKLITLVVIATGQVQHFHYSYLPGVAYPNPVRVAATIRAGGLGNPYSQLYTV